MTEPDPRRVVAEGYDRLGERYYAWTTANDPRFRADYLGRLVTALRPGSSVLELGCGPGRPVAETLAPKHHFVGVDISESQLRMARRDVPRGRFLHADITTVEFRAASFDAIVAFYSLIHLTMSDHPAVIAKIARWLRPGGVFVGNFVGRENPGSIDAWIDDVPMFWSGPEPEKTVELLRAAGFDVVSNEVLANFEDGREAWFLWILARKR